MYQWLPIIFIALHTWHHTAQNGLPAKNRNHVTILDTKIALWRLGDHPIFTLYCVYCRANQHYKHVSLINIESCWYFDVSVNDGLQLYNSRSGCSLQY